MNVLLIGSGGREHALAWKLRQSPRLKELHAIPGSAAIAELAACPAIAQNDFDAIREYALDKKIDLVVIGPEEPLAKGLGDILALAGLKVFGPSQKGAMLEASKQFAKEFMRRHQLPTADFQILYDAAFAREKIGLNKKYPVVIKADGLAAGKGVRICKDEAQALEAVSDFMEKRIFGFSGSKVLMEEHLSGREISVMALTDGESYLMLPVARDHKRLLDGDAGPNTGGMGAVAPVDPGPAVMETVKNEILQRFVDGVKKDRIPFRGVIYAGLMLTAAGPKLLEFNVRFGDPETQALLPLLDCDLLELLKACADGNLAGKTAPVHGGACAAIVLSAKGYPENPEKGKEIGGLGEVPADAVVFHSGTRKTGGRFVTGGGRVLSVAARAATAEEARKKAYAAVEKIKFAGMHYRKDIGL
ncbi:MAG: phosphoribosylamine--glycine ligase [Elusimicrobia bacterium RIFOXYB2_FULL_62_6]|nr:MAG: phosphoribosylamine--glycine ligase [Elusimicrobia bacterium RIFOXYB2_FULL_62_6]